jgi:hypothetical protein
MESKQGRKAPYESLLLHPEDLRRMLAPTGNAESLRKPAKPSMVQANTMSSKLFDKPVAPVSPN